MFGKYNGFVSKARVSAFMYFLVIFYQGLCRDKYSKYIFSPLPINMCSFTTRRAYNFSNINSARAFCQKHRSVYVEIVIRLLN